MENEETYKDLSGAVIAQLNAEIKGDGLNVSVMAKKIGVDYNTLRRYLKNERDIPMPIFYAIVDQLSIDEADLFKLARGRLARR
jgi:hypothetical protein